MAHTITFTSQFTLTFKIKISDVKKVDRLLTDNKFEPEKWTQMRTPFDNIVEYRMKVSLRSAETVRQLIKNHKIVNYDE